MSADTLPDILTLEELTRHYGPITMHAPLSRTDFATLAGRYPDLQMEREVDGIVSVMSPVKKGSGRRESTLFLLLGLWWHKHKQGELYGSSTGFDLPDGSNKSPDVAWLSHATMSIDTATEEDFPRVVPDFVGEVRSSSDRLPKLKHKMTNTWMANGVRLAWLIDPYEEKAYVYRQGQAVEELSGFDDAFLSGEDILPGFMLDLREMKRGE